MHREREAIAFSSRVKPAFPGALTVPQPFKLSGDADAAARRQRLLEESEVRGSEPAGSVAAPVACRCMRHNLGPLAAPG